MKASRRRAIPQNMKVPTAVFRLPRVWTIGMERVYAGTLCELGEKLQMLNGEKQMCLKRFASSVFRVSSEQQSNGCVSQKPLEKL